MNACCFQSLVFEITFPQFTRPSSKERHVALLLYVNHNRTWSTLRHTRSEILTSLYSIQVTRLASLWRPLSEFVANNILLMQNLFLWRWWNSTVRYFLIHTNGCGLQSWWPLCDNRRKFYEWELDGVSTNSAGRDGRLYPILERHGDRFEQAATDRIKCRIEGVLCVEVTSVYRRPGHQIDQLRNREAVQRQIIY